VTIISLRDCRHAVFILPCASGIFYSNQAGGMLCEQPSIEGVGVPLETLIDETSLMNFWSEDGLNSYYERTQAFFQDPFVKRDFKPMPETQTLAISEWGEAWVPVMVRPKPRTVALRELADRVGILTYQNSD
jgi:hypothetical protein